MVVAGTVTVTSSSTQRSSSTTWPVVMYWVAMKEGEVVGIEVGADVVVGDEVLGGGAEDVVDEVEKVVGKETSFVAAAKIAPGMYVSDVPRLRPEE